MAAVELVVLKAQSESERRCGIWGEFCVFGDGWGGCGEEEEDWAGGVVGAKGCSVM